MSASYHKRLEHYEAMAMLMGGRYLSGTHTIEITNGGKFTLIDPDTLEVISSRWHNRDGTAADLNRRWGVVMAWADYSMNNEYEGSFHEFMETRPDKRQAGEGGADGQHDRPQTPAETQPSNHHSRGG